MAIRFGEPIPVDKSAEYLPPETVEAHQLAQLRQLLANAEKNRFYAPRFAAVGVRASDLKTLSDLSCFPTFRKQDIVDDLQSNPPLGSILQIPPTEIAHVVETSGTTGLGQECYAMSSMDEANIVEMEARGFSGIGIGQGSRVLNCIPMTTTAAGMWYYLGFKRLGATIFQIGNYSSRRKIDYLRRYGCDLLVATPSYIKRLEVVARGMGFDPKELGVKAFLVAGEPYAVEWVQDLEATWSARLFEQYGCTQRAMAWTCELGAVSKGQRGMLHFMPDWCIYEVVDPDTGEHVAPFETGELIITSLVGEATPIIRFATGDKVHYLPHGHCSCGRTTAGIAAGLVNRFDNMIKIRGVNVWPEAIDQIIFRHSDIHDYQGEVYTDHSSGAEEVRITVEPKEGTQLEQGFLNQLGADVAAAVGVRVEIVPHYGSLLMGDEHEGFVKRTRWADRRSTRG